MKNEEPPEHGESLWMLTLSPLIWCAHFLLSYLTAAIWCARVAGPDGSLTAVRLAIVAYTVPALIGIAVAGRFGFRRHTFGTATHSHDFDSPHGRHGFIGFSIVLLSIVSAIATLYVALPIVFIRTCR